MALLPFQVMKLDQNLILAMDGLAPEPNEKAPPCWDVLNILEGLRSWVE